MKDDSRLIFNLDIGQMKPENIVNRHSYCPFCDRPNLTNIIEKYGSIWLIKNKYPVLEDTYQTVLIETDDCDSELSLYPKRHLYDVIGFGLKKWLEMLKSGDYVSVIFYKNHGPYSGGTIRHPHMQIVGLKKVDCMLATHKNHFTGTTIAKTSDAELNLSDNPRIGFFEFNVLLRNSASHESFSDFIQLATHFVLNRFNRTCNSYNLFFYYLDNTIIAKIVPRFITSPLFIGYSIPQVASEKRRKQLLQDIQEIYF